jgi:SepF-like predicted cell division protein (DUF552 family)
MKYYGIQINGKVDPNYIESDRYSLYEKYRETKFENYLHTNNPDVEIVEFEVKVKRIIPKEELEEFIERIYGGNTR